MNHLEFMKYHNYHIEFAYQGKRLSGVVLDYIPFNKKKNDTDYIFIPTKNLVKWRTATNLERKKLQEVIDIQHISSVSFYNPKE